MAKRIKWLKGENEGAPQCRRAGEVEVNDDDLCARYVELGLAEYVADGIEASPEDRSLRPEKTRRK